MASEDEPRGHISSATLALGAAGLLAIGAVAIAIVRSDEPVAPANNMVAAAGAPTMDQMVASLSERVRLDPDNHEAWYLLGMAYREGGRFSEAEQAFRRAMELAPQNADYTAYLAETLLLIHGAEPPPEAEQLLRRTIELQPGNPQARYYLATLKDMAGDHRGAVDDLVALLREAPADAPWQAQVREAVTGIAQRNQIDIAGRIPPAPPAPPPSTATAAIPGPTREQMEAARAIPPSQQDEMVRGMVEGLANRLRQNPRDAEGWIRLMRSRMVLNQPDQAREALQSGLNAFEGDPAVQGRLRNAAAELAIPTG